MSLKKCTFYRLAVRFLNTGIWTMALTQLHVSNDLKKLFWSLLFFSPQHCKVTSHCGSEFRIRLDYKLSLFFPPVRSLCLSPGEHCELCSDVVAPTNMTGFGSFFRTITVKSRPLPANARWYNGESFLLFFFPQTFYQLMRFQSTKVQLENSNAILGCCYRGLWFVKSHNEIFSHPDVQMVSGCSINNSWRASRRT